MSAFRGIDPDGLDLTANGLEWYDSALTGQANEVYAILEQHGRHADADAAGGVLTRAAYWCRDRVVDLRWRADAIRTAQAVPPPTSGYDLWGWISTVEKANLAASGEFGEENHEHVFGEYLESIYGQGPYGPTVVTTPSVQMLAALAAEYQRLGQEINDEAARGVPDSQLSQLENERGRILRLMKDLTGAEVTPGDMPGGGPVTDDEPLVNIGTSATPDADYGSDNDDEPYDFSAEVWTWNETVGDSLAGWEFESIPGAAEINVLGWEAGAGAVIGFGDDGIEIDLAANAAAYLVEVEYAAAAGPMTIEAEGQIGAEAAANAAVQFDPMGGDLEIEATGSAVLGASGSAGAELDLHYGTVGAGVDGYAGLAIEGHLETGLDDWELNWDFGFGAAVGLGGGFEVEGSLDLKELGSDAWGAAEAAGGALRDFGGWVGGLAG